MKIAIIGTRGIPNRYGGFEQLAQHLATNLTQNGHKVSVYLPAYRTDVDNEWNGIQIRKIFFIRWLGSLFHFVYDFLSIKDSLKKEDDIILVCGYVTSLPALLWYKKHKNKFFIHTDGFEWKRTKWNIVIRVIIKWEEKILARFMPNLITDHPIIYNYFKQKYGKESTIISYGFNPEISSTDVKGKYFLVIARNEPENQIEMICNAYLAKTNEAELWIFTNKPLKKSCNHPKIKVWLNEYNEPHLNNIRKNCLAYIHAYTVGGTNPSLIEAMAFCPIIFAYRNEFHTQLLEDDAFYFSTAEELAKLISEFNYIQHSNLSQNLQKKISTWNFIAEQYENLFKKCLYETS